jgi:hypothetical protein
VPVLELEPGRFSTVERPLPSGSGREVPGEWDRYWRESLADAGIAGLTPLRPGSWHVPPWRLRDPKTLGLILAATVESWGGAESLTDPDGKPVLDGGLALCQRDEVLAEPACCVDLGNLSDWREAVASRGPEWRMLWIGHPWLSVRFDGRWLVLAGPHESDSPEARWAIAPDDLDAAVHRAQGELVEFASMLEPAVAAFVGKDVVGRAARRLAGLGG